MPRTSVAAAVWYPGEDMPVVVSRIPTTTDSDGWTKKLVRRVFDSKHGYPDCDAHPLHWDKLLWEEVNLFPSMRGTGKYKTFVLAYDIGNDEIVRYLRENRGAGRIFGLCTVGPVVIFQTKRSNCARILPSNVENIDLERLENMLDRVQTYKAPGIPEEFLKFVVYPDQGEIHPGG